MSYSDKETEKRTKSLEKKIRSVYNDAYKELKETTDSYFMSFMQRDAEMQKQLEDGKIDESYYQQWKLNNIGRGQRWESVRDSAAKRTVEANKVAASYINDATPGIYSLNANFEAYQIETLLKKQNLGNGASMGVSFNLVDEQTVKNLMEGNNQSTFRTVRVNPVRDYKWNQKKIDQALTSGIIQGKSVKHMSEAFLSVMENNHTAAVRNARTAMTSAQNAGRQQTYEKAVDMGIEMQKEWMSFVDDRTRESHLELNGVRVDYDEEFPNGLMYPGDPSGEPAEVYNCRCTMRAILPGFSNADYRVTGNSVDSYNQYLSEKEV